METPRRPLLRIGDWCVDPSSGELSRNGETVQLEARAARLLVHLAEHPGEVVSIDDLLENVWSGVPVSPDSVYQAVASLRRQLGDDPKRPTYIATVPRLGYRMVAPVSAAEPGTLSATREQKARPAKTIVWATVAVVLVAGLSFAFWKNRRPASSAEKSIAVLPFLDLTEKMSHEIFADGMTEEIIDELSLIPGCRVAAPRTTFQLKGKKMPIAEVGKTLGVAYVLDGSIRKSASTMRVAARLVQTNNGYVVWSHSYERPWEESVRTQKEIAEEVMKAVKISFGR